MKHPLKARVHQVAATPIIQLAVAGGVVGGLFAFVVTVTDPEYKRMTPEQKRAELRTTVGTYSLLMAGMAPFGLIGYHMPSAAYLDVNHLVTYDYRQAV